MARRPGPSPERRNVRNEHWGPVLEDDYLRTYFYYPIPEFETVAVPIAVCFLVIWGWRRESRRSPRSRGRTTGREIPIGLSLVDGADDRSAGVVPEEVRDSGAA